MSGRKKNGRGARRPAPVALIAVAVATVGGIGGLALASFVTGGASTYAGIDGYDYPREQSAFEATGTATDMFLSADDSLSGPEDYRCRGCGPGIAARMAASYGGSGYYDGSDHDYGGTVDAATYPDDASAELPAYRPLPFAESHRPPSVQATAPAVKAPILPVLKPDRLPVAAAGESPLLPPATTEHQPAGSQPQQQQRRGRGDIDDTAAAPAA